jgi:hypothetical protein
MSWQAAITDPEEKLVFDVLGKEDYRWRTIGGIARETGLSEGRVSEIIAKHDLKLTRFSEVPSISGSALVGLIEKVGA